jgi:hypothetical protein
MPPPTILRGPHLTPDVEEAAIWLTVCTPPACHLPKRRGEGSSGLPELLEHTRLTSGLPIVVLDRLHGRETYMQGLSRSNKLQMVREYLRSGHGEQWRYVVFSDVLDVLAGTGSARELHAALASFGAADENSSTLVASSEPACWVGAKCSSEAIDQMRRAQSEHFASHAHFPCSGQYAGSRMAVLRFVDWALHMLALPATPPPVTALFGAQGDVARSDDQGLLTLYWLLTPGAVVIDQRATLFGNLARWYALKRERLARSHPTASPLLSQVRAAQ